MAPVAGSKDDTTPCSAPPVGVRVRGAKAALVSTISAAGTVLIGGHLLSAVKVFV
jgi:hypothetical protein